MAERARRRRPARTAGPPDRGRAARRRSCRGRSCGRSPPSGRGRARRRHRTPAVATTRTSPPGRSTNTTAQSPAAASSSAAAVSRPEQVRQRRCSSPETPATLTIPWVRLGASSDAWSPPRATVTVESGLDTEAIPGSWVPASESLGADDDSSLHLVLAGDPEPLTLKISARPWPIFPGWWRPGSRSRPFRPPNGTRGRRPCIWSSRTIRRSPSPSRRGPN